MAFPLTPIVGQQHTEAGIKYEWTGSSWDLVIGNYQKLIESTVDPTPADVAEQGQIWRNTITGNAWEYSENFAAGTSEWVRIVSDKSIQISATQPITQPDGTTLQAGDIWIDSANSDRAFYFTVGGSWEPLKIYFDNTTANLVGAPTTTQEAIDILAQRAATLTKGLSFVGSYDATTDQADFTTVSGLTDGPLPAAGITNENTYLIVTVSGTPTTGPLTGTAMKVGDYVVSDGVTWTLVPLSASVTDFTGLTDTPSSYVGQAGKFVAVNSTETELEFVSSPDTHSILQATEPTLRPNGSALSVGDRWVDSTTLNTYVYNGATFDRVVPVIVGTTAPTQTTEGLLWYNPNVNVLYVRDNTAGAWIGI